MQTMRIEFRRQRDFSDKISATFDFLRLNFRSIFRSLVLIAGPTIFIGVGLLIIFGSRISGDWDTVFNDTAKSEPVTFFSLVLGAVLYLSFIYTTIMTVIYSYIQLYLENSDAVVDTQTVFECTKNNFFKVTKAIFGTTILLLVVFGTFAGLLFGFTSGVALVSLLFLFFIPSFIYVAITLFFVPFISVIEEKGFFSSVSRSFYIIQDYWWKTFGYVLIIIIIQIFLGYMVQLPWMIYMSSFPFISLAERESSILYTIGHIFFFLLYIINTQMLYILQTIAVAFQYFNIVEIKEGVGLQQRINKVGENKKEDEEDF